MGREEKRRITFILNFMIFRWPAIP